LESFIVEANFHEEGDIYCTSSCCALNARELLKSSLLFDKFPGQNWNFADLTSLGTDVKVVSVLKIDIKRGILESRIQSVLEELLSAPNGSEFKHLRFERYLPINVILSGMKTLDYYYRRRLYCVLCSTNTPKVYSIRRIEVATR
jgi:hypothetical protein